MRQRHAVQQDSLQLQLDDGIPDFLVDLRNRPGRRPAGIEPLNQIDSEFDDGLQLLEGFHALRQRPDIVPMRKVDGIPDKQLLVGILIDIADQRPVNLDNLRSIAEQIDDIVVSCSVVVNGDLHLISRTAHPLDPFQLLVRRRIVFRQFHHEAVQITAVTLHDLTAVFLGQEKTRNGVDENLAAVERPVFPHILPDNSEERGPFHIIQPVVFPGNAQNLRGIHLDAAARTHQRFIGINLSGPGVHDGLIMILEQLFTQQQHQGAVQNRLGGILDDILPGTGFQLVQIHLSGRQMYQVFHRRISPPRVQRGIAEADIHRVFLPAPGTVFL